MNANIEINAAELKSIRAFLSSQRRHDAYSADDGDAMLEVLRRAACAAAYEIPLEGRRGGECIVCGCTEKDPCPSDDYHGEACSWEHGQAKTICTHCADA